MAKKKAKRTTHRSGGGKKLYAKRDKGGKFKDIQTFKRAHGADVKRKSKAERGKAAPVKSGAIAVKAVPDGFHTVTPYLIVNGAAGALDFYRRAFGAKEQVRMPGPEGKVMHAEILIGDSKIMLADEFPQMGARSPQSIGGTPVGICLYVAKVDAVYEQAIAAGAKIERPLKDQFYGDRSGTVIDPFGHKWTIATHIEDVSPAEMEKRMAAMSPPA
jgi:PhnB protein